MLLKKICFQVLFIVPAMRRERKTEAEHVPVRRSKKNAPRAERPRERVTTVRLDPLSIAG
jgi:hypothetical protein